MKTTLFALFFAVAASSALGQSQNSTQPVQVTVQSEARELARGFARASSELNRPPVTLVLQKEGILRVIEDVRQVRDSEGVLVVEQGKGLIYLVNPRDVLYITDGSQVSAPAPKTK